MVRRRTISTYRDTMGVEVDLIIDTQDECLAIEIKSSVKAHEKMFKGLNRFEQDSNQLGRALPYQTFLEKIIPTLSSQIYCF